MTEPTAKQRHRAAAFDLHRNDSGMVRCVLRGSIGHECGGRLQAHHSIPVQTLKRLHAQALRGAQMTGIRPVWEERLAAVSLDELIADGRNSDVSCEVGHRQIELRRFALTPHPALIEFSQDYGLEHYLPTQEQAA